MAPFDPARPCLAEAPYSCVHPSRRPTVAPNTAQPGSNAAARVELHSSLFLVLQGAHAVHPTALRRGAPDRRPKLSPLLPAADGQREFGPHVLSASPSKYLWDLAPARRPAPHQRLIGFVPELLSPPVARAPSVHPADRSPGYRSKGRI